MLFHKTNGISNGLALMQETQMIPLLMIIIDEKTIYLLILK